MTKYNSSAPIVGVHSMKTQSLNDANRQDVETTPRLLSQISNAAFSAAIFHVTPADANVAICSKAGDPNKDVGWFAKRAESVDAQCPASRNNYLNCSSFHVESTNTLKAKKDYFVACHAVILDDVGTKFPVDNADVLGPPSWMIETSPANYQVGYILDVPITDFTKAQALLKAISAAGLGDPGSLTPIRWMRLPNAINGKAKYNAPDGSKFRCRLASWNPERRYSAIELTAAAQAVAPPLPALPRYARNSVTVRAVATGISHEVFHPKPNENPVVAALKSQGLHKRDLGDGRHEMTCPWLTDHTDKVDGGTVYFEPSPEYPAGGFRCHHSHGGDLSIANLNDLLGVDHDEARHRHTIRLVSGALDQIAKAAEYVLADRGDVYQSGGIIVHIRRDPETGDPRIEPANDQSLTVELSARADWGRYDARTKKLIRCDPPEKVIKALLKALKYDFLPPLKGIARQPFYHANELVTASGYHEKSGIFASFSEDEFAVPDKSRDAADQALDLLLSLVEEVEFATDIDLAAALSAMFTAAVRASLPLAPAFLTTAADSGIGKSYLNSIVTPFAGPGEPQRTSFPKTSEEATKSVQSHLLTGAAVIEYDDMDGDFLPHGALNRMLTSEHLTDRILGVSKTVTVNTRALVLASGINVGPVRDMNRRVITIRLARKQQGGITRSFNGRPAKEVRANRGKYVSAVLTIIEAWKAAGSPMCDAPSLASYGDEWSHYCRFPLIWMGQPDPAHSLIVQVEHDPDLEQFGLVLREWYAKYGSTPVTVRKVKEANTYGGDDELYEALLDLPVTEGGRINADRLGWLLKKKANKVIDGLALREGSADGRKGWWVEKLPDQTPPLPAFPSPIDENGTASRSDGRPTPT